MSAQEEEDGVAALHARARELALLLGLPAERLADERCASAYRLRTGRPPMLGDAVPPWRYRGWLLLLVQQLHAFCERLTGFPDRWGYLREIVETRRLPDRPIPRVEFTRADAAVLKKTDGWVTILDRSLGRWDSFRDFCRFLAFGLGVLAEDPALPDEASEALYRAVDLGQWLCHPSDYLGEVAQQRFGGGPHAFFATPHELAEAMARMTFGEGDNRRKSCSDPAMGTGRMLLHASNHCLRLAGQDIDEVMVLCTKVNLAVYAPWGLVKVDDLLGPEPVAVATKYPRLG